MSEPPQSSTAQRTMLVVDDQHSVCMALAYFLEWSGYRVLTAESGLAAIATVEKEPIDGALIDVHMPVMNGFDTCLRLQGHARSLGRELRVWFMTGAHSTVLERRGAEVGAFAVFRKPFDHSAFLARLEHDFSSPLLPLPATTSAEGDGVSADASP